MSNEDPILPSLRHGVPLQPYILSVLRDRWRFGTNLARRKKLRLNSIVLEVSEGLP